jgi:hypothetical protein
VRKRARGGGGNPRAGNGGVGNRGGGRATWTGGGELGGAPEPIVRLLFLVQLAIALRHIIRTNVIECSNFSKST